MALNDYKLLKKRARNLRVDEAGVQDDILKWYKEEVTLDDMVSKLAERHIKISRSAIYQWLEEQKKTNIVQTRIASKEKFEVMIMDYKKEITDIHNEVKQMKEMAKDKGDLIIYDKMIGRLYQGIELLAKVMGDIKPQGMDVNIIINQITERTTEINRRLRGNLHSSAMDVEGTIIEEDKKEEERLNG